MPFESYLRYHAVVEWHGGTISVHRECSVSLYSFRTADHENLEIYNGESLLRRNRTFLVLMRSTRHTRIPIRTPVSLFTTHRFQHLHDQHKGQKSHQRLYRTIPTVGTQPPVRLHRQSPRSTIPSPFAGDRLDTQSANMDIPNVLRANGLNIYSGGLSPNARHRITTMSPTSRQPRMGVSAKTISTLARAPSCTHSAHIRSRAFT